MLRKFESFLASGFHFLRRNATLAENPITLYDRAKSVH
jgi:hypothetical protein